MRLDRAFYEQDVLDVAPALIGKILVHKSSDLTAQYQITEVEAYKGTEDLASHARFGKTTRNAVMFEKGGLLYVYFIYGMYWMLNIVTGKENDPQAVLIRGIKDINGPGKVARALGIGKSFYGMDLVNSDILWIDDQGYHPPFLQIARYGISYASEPWKSMPWRYVMVPKP
jgi:DNA-3-methyladenine glycosylase